MKLLKTINCIVFILANGLAVAKSPQDDIFETECGRIVVEIVKQGCKKECFLIKWMESEKLCKRTGEYDTFLGLELQYMDRQEEARALYNKVIQNPSLDSRGAYLGMVQSCIDNWEIELAEKNILECVRKYPNWHWGYIYYAHVLICQDRYLDAKIQIENSLKIFDEEPLAYGLLSIIAFRDRANGESLDVVMNKVLTNFKKAISFNKPSSIVANIYIVNDVSKACIFLKKHKWVEWLLRSVKLIYPGIAEGSLYKKRIKEMAYQSLLENKIGDVFTPEEEERLFVKKENPVIVLEE